MKLASITLSIFRTNRDTGWLDGVHVVPVLRDAIDKKGWVTANGSLRTSEIAPNYLAWCQALRGPLELGSLPRSEQDSASQIGRLLRPWRTGTHPLRVVVAIGWLFDSLDSFIEAYDAFPVSGIAIPQEIRSSEVMGAATTTTGIPMKGKLVDLVRAGMSATAAANTVGVTVGTAMGWAAQSGIAVAKRPKSLNSGIQKSLRRTLLGGVDKKAAAVDHCISVQAVTRFLRTEPGLHKAWQDAVFHKKLATARCSWTASMATHGHLGTKWLRAEDPSIYAWLYRNDRAWLQMNLPKPVARIAHAAFNWDDRDLALSALVEKAMAELKAKQPDKPVQLWQIYQSVPQLKPKLSALHRLPLTRRVIELGLGRTKVKGAKVLL